MKCRNVLRRVLAAALCLCVCLGLVEMALPAWASPATGDVPCTEFYMEHVYLGSDVYLTQYGQVYPTGYDQGGGGVRYEVRKSATTNEGYNWADGNNKSGQYEEFGVHVYPTAQTYYDETFMATVTEDFTGFEIIEGNDAVTWVSEADDPRGYGDHFWIRYNPTVQNVVLYLFYSYDGQTLLGANFGSDLDGVPGVDPDVDVLEVTPDNIGPIQDAVKDDPDNPLKDVKEGDIIYNTGAGLHTNKRVSADVLEDGRTFDVGLESWYAATNNAANVGFILDSSGSMAFAPAGSMSPYDVDSGADKPYEARVWSKGYGLYVPIPTECFQDEWFTAGNTDNSPLAYSGYSYYVFDDRDTVNELVPLAYWDGKMDGADNPLKAGLVGLYQFERTADGSDPDFLKNGVSDDGSATEVSTSHSKTGGDYKQDNNSKKDVTPYKGAFQAYDGDHEAHSIIDLDATVSDPNNFTISFAVKTDSNGKINESLNGKDGPQAEDLVTIKDESGNVLYTILRGTKGSGNSQNHVRWVSSGGTTDVDVKSALNTSKDNKANYGKYTVKSWRVFTFVVEDGHVTTYIDGTKAVYEDGGNKAEGDVDFSGATSLKFTLGGEDQFLTGPTLQIDEVYIYDGRALDDGQVSDLVSTMKDPTGSVNKSLDAKYANVNGTTMNLYKYEQFSGLSQSEREGWYYVNSTSSYEDIEESGSAKSLHGLTTGGSYPDDMGVEDSEPGGNVLYNKYELVSSTGEKLEWYDEDSYTKVTGKTAAYKAGDPVRKASPCIIYMGQITHAEVEKYGLDASKEGVLAPHCVFSPSGSDVKVSLVFQKVSRTSDGVVTQTANTKAQSLQLSLNTFINRLRVNSPSSKLSAVRFSAEDYGSHEEELLLQTWTNDPAVSTGMMNLSRGDGVEAGMAEAGDHTADGLYNYVITGGTCAYTGLAAFKNQLASSPDIDGDVAQKYIVLFTDGQDDELKEVSGITDPNDPTIQATKAVGLAKELGDLGYTIFTVRLVSGDAASQSGQAKAFLQAIANQSAGGKYFEAATAEALDEVFNSIIDEMPFKLTGYSVKDYIDPRFDLVADTESPASGTAVRTREIVHLHDGGTIHIGEGDGTGAHYELAGADSGGHEFYFSTAQADGEGGYAERYTKATLKYDSGKGLYYLEWTNQNIPLCREGAHNLAAWSAVVTLRAKEDFIGGNALLTNGPESSENMVFDPDDGSPSSGTDKAKLPASRMPSKGFPRTQVNVKPYRMVTDPTVDVRYLGETMAPREALEDLFASASEEMRDLDHLNVTLSEWDDRDGSGYYYEYVKRYLTEHPEKYAGADLEADFGLFLDELLTGAAVSLDYSFLPAVSSGGDHDHGTQTGGDAYEADVLGKITYQWAAVTDDASFDRTLSANAATPVQDATPKRYKLTVSYEPTAPEGRNERSLITDLAYADLKAPVGAAAAAPDPAVAVHTTYVATGELSLMVRASKASLEARLAAESDKMLTLTADVTRASLEGVPDETFTNKSVSFTLYSGLVGSASPDAEGNVSLYLSADQDLKGLAMGSYTLTLDPAKDDNGQFASLTAANAGDYNEVDFSAVPPTGHESYVASSTTDAGVTFRMGAANEPAAVDRAAMTENLAAWVDEKLAERLGDYGYDGRGQYAQDQLNEMSLDPCIISGATLADYLNARLGMPTAGVSPVEPAYVTLTTEKTLTGSLAGTLQRGFTFQVAAEAGGDPAEVTATVNNDGAPVAVTLMDEQAYYVPGTYTYTVSETNDGEAGFTYDSRAYTVKVTTELSAGLDKITVTSVTVEGGGLAAPVTLTDTDSVAEDSSYAYAMSKAGAVFANTYAAPPAPDAIYVNLGAAKTLDGATAMDADLFTFRLQGEGVNMTAKNTADGHISFGPITYAKAGEYAYTLWEEAGVGNYKYDETHHDVVVTVVEDGGVLQVASILVDGADKTASPTELAVFANETIPVDPGVAYIMGTKVFANGGAGQTFTFKLEAGTASIALPAIMSVPVPDPEASPDAEPQPNEGAPGMDGPTADTPAPEDTPATADTPAPEETPVPTDTPAPTDTPVPTDTPAPEDTAAPAEAAVQPVLLGAAVRPMGVAAMRAPALLSMRTAGEGVPEPGPNAGQTPEGEQTPPAGETTTQPGEGLTETPGGDPSSEDLPANAGGTQPEIMPLDLGVVPMPDVTEDTTDGSGTFSFGPITFTQAGTYTYTVSEVAGSDPGIYYDKTVYTVTFVVTDAGGGELSVGAPTITDAAGGESSSILFLNAAVSKTSGTAGDTVNEGDTLTYDVSWANFSNSSSVTVTDLFDPGVDFKTASFTGAVPTGFSKTGDSYAWHYEDQHPGDAGAIEITVQVNENADEDWRYVSGGTLAGETYGESVPTVYNRASVQCGAETMLTSTISNIVLPKSPPVPPTATGSLKVTKTVIGGDAGQDFTFQVHVEDAENETYGDTVFDGAGLTTFTLQDGGSKTISGLPAGKRYQVSETESADYKTTAVNDNGTIPAGSEAVAAFTNEKVTSPGPGTDPSGPGTDPDGPGGDPGPSGPGSQPGTTPRSGGAVGTAPMTGDDASAAPWLLLLGASCTGLAMVANRRKRKQR